MLNPSPRNSSVAVPVDLVTYANEISAYKASIPPALDGGKAAIVQKNKLRKAVTKSYVQLAHYAEANCNDDVQTFLLSGFKLKPSGKTAAPPLSDKFRRVERGKLSGTIILTLLKVLGAMSYTVRYGAVPAGGGVPATWTTQPVSAVRPPTTISGLTPGTVYAFQVRALLKDNVFTDWSDSVTIMCV
jgi:hypothetical protein